MRYENCRIGQLNRCNSTGCEWKKVFGGYCWLRPTKIETDFIESKKKVEIKKVVFDHSPINVKQVAAENTFKIVKQEEWIKKIKVKL